MFSSAAAVLSSPTSQADMPAMTALTLTDLKGINHTLAHQKLTVEPAFELSTGLQLKAPRFEGKPIVLDLASKPEVWLQIREGFDYLAEGCGFNPHHAASGAKGVKLLLSLPKGWNSVLKTFDEVVQSLSLTGEELPKFNWLPLIRSHDSLCASVVVSGSEAPTIIHFISADGVLSKGTGLEFLKAQLGDSKLTDFECKARVELQFVEEDPESFRKFIAVKVHSIAFVRKVVTEVLDYSDQNLEFFARSAAKRLKKSV